jgi:hypothetical protein
LTEFSHLTIEERVPVHPYRLKPKKTPWQEIAKIRFSFILSYKV